VGTVEQQQLIVDEMNGEGLAAEGDDPFPFLIAVKNDPRQPMARRVKVALELMPYYHPKLSAMAVSSMNSNDFAKLLDKAIERSRGNGRNAPPQLELTANPEGSDGRS
jgi:hypothetical protein